MFKKFIKNIYLFIFILLTSCSQYSFFNQANAQSLHQYKHKKTSRTFVSAKNYQAKGLASWYGSEFHRKRTSSGERFNMYQLTAAHKTLPLDTYVQVTNLSNGKHVIVKINDRGPFIHNRLIDLSYAAAKKIGMVRKGTTPVSIKALHPVYSM